MNNWRQPHLTRTLLVGAFFLILALGACGDESGDSGSGSGGAGTTSDDGGGATGGSGAADGSTQCGMDGVSQTCAAGQYCSDPRFTECSLGCLSNTNCAGDQTCVVASGQSVGECQNNETTPGGPAEDAFCGKLSACQISIDCVGAFSASSVECRTCIVDENCTDILDFDGACDAACGF